MIFALLCLIATAFAAPLAPADAGDTWLQVCCQDNDLNSSGGISFREFTVFALNLMNLNRAEMERLFLSGDVDRNSELDGDECIPMRAALKKTLKEKGDQLLTKYDLDKDEALSEDEATSLAKNEFGLFQNETGKDFILADLNADHKVSAGEEMSELMLNLRGRQVTKGGANLSRFDVNHDGKVSYEEIKPEILRDTDGFTLKQMFKGIDFDKDYHLTNLEYLALLNELDIRKKEGDLSTAPKTIQLNTDSQTVTESKKNEEEIVVPLGDNKTEVAESAMAKSAENTTATTDLAPTTVTATVEVQIRDKRAADRDMIRVPAARTMQEFQFDEEPMRAEKTEGTAGMWRSVKNQPASKYDPRRTKRGADNKEETAPPVVAPAKELDKEKMKELSEKIKNNLSGGGRAPSIDDSVTVPYDDKDFQ